MQIQNNTRSLCFLSLLFALCCFVSAAILSLWNAKSMGVQRRWDLSTGRYTDTTYLFGITIKQKESSSGLEALFLGTPASRSNRSVLVYSKSILQPIRGGRAMAVANTAKKISEELSPLSENDRLKLLNLIQRQNIDELYKWYENIHSNYKQPIR